ncbi:Fur family transcriptional regulator [Sulfitobacter sp. HNIBRBA2951]|uniref:Fur family transcriptional regulator n=1 Tax=Sulfitobacter aquimarinus TaxID=3158557 RepID=UPI0032DEF82F
MSGESDKTEKMTAALRKAGIRVTRQRIALLGVLADADDHPDAVELHARARAVEPSVSLATVYRTLSVLQEQGVVHRHAFEGGGARFETTHEDHHDHILDVDTGEVIEFQSDIIERVQDEIARELGYEVVHHRLELYCRKKR